MITQLYKKSKLLLILLFKTYFIAITAQHTVKTDHHVHIFSPELLKELKSHKYGAEQFQGPVHLYADIDTIMKLNQAKKIWLISTAYAYRETSESEALEIQQQLSEQNFLSNAALKYPNRIETFYGINPIKSYALQLIKRSHQFLNFTGIKLHFHASHIDFRKNEHVEALKEIFEYTAKHHLPILIHFQNHKSDFGKAEVDYFFNYILPQGLPQSLIFAHLGGGGWMTEKSILIAESIIDNLNRSTKQHKIKFEISGILSDRYKDYESLEDQRKYEVLSDIGFDKLLFGSDYPLINSSSYFNMVCKRLDLSKKEIRSLRNKSQSN